MKYCGSAKRKFVFFVLLKVKHYDIKHRSIPIKAIVIVLAPKFKRSEVDGALADEFKDQMIEL